LVRHSTPRAPEPIFERSDAEGRTGIVESKHHPLSIAHILQLLFLRVYLRAELLGNPDATPVGQPDCDCAEQLAEGCCDEKCG